VEPLPLDVPELQGSKKKDGCLVRVCRMVFWEKRASDRWHLKEGRGGGLERRHKGALARKNLENL